jgi:hypothetical protein
MQYCAKVTLPRTFWRESLKSHNIKSENYFLSSLRISTLKTANINKVKGEVIPVQAMEALKVARRRGSHIF